MAKRPNKRVTFAPNVGISPENSPARVATSPTGNNASPDNAVNRASSSNLASNSAPENASPASVEQVSPMDLTVKKTANPKCYGPAKRVPRLTPLRRPPGLIPINLNPVLAAIENVSVPIEKKRVNLPRGIAPKGTAAALALKRAETPL